MAHWIIADIYNTKVYKCSACGAEWHDCVYSPDEWKNCPHCNAYIETEERINPETTAVEPTLMKDVVILSIEKYDKIMSDLVKLGEDLEVANRDKEHCLDIFKKIGITEEYLEKMIPSSLGVGMDENPMTREKRITIQFRMREV